MSMIFFLFSLRDLGFKVLGLGLDLDLDLEN